MITLDTRFLLLCIFVGWAHGSFIGWFCNEGLRKTREIQLQEELARLKHKLFSGNMWGTR
jgi:hypothetical protein